MSLIRTAALGAATVAACAGMAFAFPDPPEPPCRGPFRAELPDLRVCRNAADFNQDSFVDFFDYDDFDVCWNGDPGCVGDPDLNCDSFVDFFDRDLFDYAWYTSPMLPACDTAEMTYHWTVTARNAIDGQMDDAPAGWGSGYDNLRLDTLLLYQQDFEGAAFDIPGASGFGAAPWAYFEDDTYSSPGPNCPGPERNFGLHTLFYIPGTTTFDVDWRDQFENRLDLWLGLLETRIEEFFSGLPGEGDPDRPGAQILLGILDFENIPMVYHDISPFAIQCPVDGCAVYEGESELRVFTGQWNGCALRELWDDLLDDVMIPSDENATAEAQLSDLIDAMVTEGFWEWPTIDTIAEIRGSALNRARFACYSYNYFSWRFHGESMDSARAASACDADWGYYGVPRGVQNSITTSGGTEYGAAPTEFYLSKAWSVNNQMKRIIESVDFLSPVMYAAYTNEPGTMKSGTGGWYSQADFDAWLLANLAGDGELPSTSVRNLLPGVALGSQTWDTLTDGMLVAVQDELGLYRPSYPFFHWRAHNQIPGTCVAGTPPTRAPNFMNHDEARYIFSAMWHMGVDGVLLWSAFYGCNNDYPEDAATSKSGFMDPVVEDLLVNDFVNQSPMCDYPQ